VDTTRVAESVDLEVPGHYAFEFLADPSTARIIDPAVREYRPASVPMQEGTRTDIRFRMWGLPVRAVSVVKQWEPGMRMVMESERPSRPVRAIASHRFEPAGRDRCTYTWEIELVPAGLLGSIAAWIFGRFMRANAAAQQARFKAEVERRWSASPGLPDGARP